MSRLGVRKDKAKQVAGWTGEKLGRLKLNGRLTSYSPLSRVVELEGLLVILEFNGAMWRAMRDVLGAGERKRLQALAERDDRRRAELEEHRLGAVAEALAS